MTKNSSMYGFSLSEDAGTAGRAGRVFDSASKKPESCVVITLVDNTSASTVHAQHPIHLFQGVGASHAHQIFVEIANARGESLDVLCERDVLDFPGDIHISSDELSLNLQAMEALLATLERALAMAHQPSAQVGDVIDYISKAIEGIQNPRRALEEELAQLVKDRQPPNGQCYAARPDKKIGAIEFFNDVYTKFQQAGILHSHQLRAMDLDLYTRLANTTSPDKPALRSKREFNDRLLNEVGASLDTLPKLTRAYYRRRTAN